MTKCKVDYVDDPLHIAFSLGPKKDGHYKLIDYRQYLIQIQPQSFLLSKETHKNHNAFAPLKYCIHKGFKRPLQNSNKQNLVQSTKKLYLTNEHDSTLTKILNDNDKLSILDILSLFNTSRKININFFQLKNHMKVFKKRKSNNMKKKVFQGNDCISTLFNENKSFFESIFNRSDNVEVPTQNSKNKKQKTKNYT